MDPFTIFLILFNGSLALLNMAFYWDAKRNGKSGGWNLAAAIGCTVAVIVNLL